MISRPSCRFPHNYESLKPKTVPLHPVKEKNMDFIAS